MKTLIVVIGIISVSFADWAAMPTDYEGKPFEDSVYKAGPQIIPGRIECAYFDFGGEGIAYHSDGTNHGSGELNLQPYHHRPQATSYIWSFRANEGVSVSYPKDIADFNHKNPVPFSPETNQLYVGWTKNGQWLNYTVNIKTAGTYKVRVLYSGHSTNFSFSLNHKLAGEYKIPTPTSGLHTWNRAEVGTITFSEAGLQLLTFAYNFGNNFAYFDFELVEKK